MKSLLFCLLLGMSFPGSALAAKSGGKGPGWAPSPINSVTGGPSGRAGGTSTRMNMLDPRKAPPLAPARKVSTQDCSKPIALDGGNLRCQ
jgi:hypothetical protein